MNVSEIDDTFGARVRAARVDKPMRQEELADAVANLNVDMTAATIGKIERGERRVTVGEASAIASALGLHIIDLTSGDGALRTSLMLLRLDVEQKELWDAFRRLGNALHALARDVSKLPDGTSLPREQIEALTDALSESPIDSARAYTDDILARILDDDVDTKPWVRELMASSWKKQLDAVDQARSAQGTEAQVSAKHADG